MTFFFPIHISIFLAIIRRNRKSTFAYIKDRV